MTRNIRERNAVPLLEIEPTVYPPENDQPDLTLERARQGDEAAFTELYQQYRPRILGYFRRRLADTEEANDLTAEVFLRMAGAIRDGKTWNISFSAWLFRIARNLLIDHVRATSRAQLTSLSDELPCKRSNATQEAIEDHVDSAELREALGAIRPEYATVLKLRYFQELSLADIGRRLGKSESAVKVANYRALRALRKECAQRPGLAAA
jgi:RNA polymerase sigma-70 factor (ECF subfamily)